METRTKSQSVVDFLGGLAPLYALEWQGAVRCARSLIDGSLYVPFDEPAGDKEQGLVRIYWQGDSSRPSEVDGGDVATIALDRYVRLHGAGYDEDAIAAELWYMAQHFTFKTGCHTNLPQLQEPPGKVERAGRRALEMGQGLLVDMLKKFIGVG